MSTPLSHLVPAHPSPSPMRTFKVYSLSNFQMYSSILVHPQNLLIVEWKFVPWTPLPISLTLHPLTLTAAYLFSVSRSFFYFCRFHICMCICTYICVCICVYIYLYVRSHIWDHSFYFSNLFYVCPQSPSMLSQLARFHFYGWTISHWYIYIPQLPYPFIHGWTLRLLPCLGYCK